MPIITIRYRKILRILFIILIGIIAISNVKWIGRTLYPINYKEYIGKYSDEYNIDPLLVAAIIRTESKYDTMAKSHKDARGLMQIGPVTGNWASQELNIDQYQPDLLYDPKTNIMIGCWYVDKLNRQFNNEINLVLAAYNGGSGNVAKWLADSRYSKDGTKLSSIPFKETELYIEKVQKSYYFYKKLYKDDDFK